jgi:S-DNA-T family DNA segregation ATPase FtsK/SpoIIIE
LPGWAPATTIEPLALWLLDGKRVELGPWRPHAERFVGPNLDDANTALAELQAEMDARYDALDGRAAQDRAQRRPPGDHAGG